MATARPCCDSQLPERTICFSATVIGHVAHGVVRHLPPLQCYHGRPELWAVSFGGLEGSAYYASSTSQDSDTSSRNSGFRY